MLEIRHRSNRWRDYCQCCLDDQRRNSDRRGSDRCSNRREEVNKRTSFPSEWELEWHPTNPPHEGLDCWIAVYTAYGGNSGTGYGFTYCEPSNP